MEEDMRHNFIATAALAACLTFPFTTDGVFAASAESLLGKWTQPAPNKEPCSGNEPYAATFELTGVAPSGFYRGRYEVACIGLSGSLRTDGRRPHAKFGRSGAVVVIFDNGATYTLRAGGGQLKAPSGRKFALKMRRK